MKKTIIITLVLFAFAGSGVLAKPQPPAKAKVAEKVDASAKTGEAEKVKADAAKAQVQDAAMGLEVLGWGGYNLTVKNSDQTATGSSLTNYHGPAGGLHAYYSLGNILPIGSLDVGLSGGYSTYSKTNDITISLIPIDARARLVFKKIFAGGDAFVGVLSGYNVYLASGITVSTKPSFIDAGLYLGYSYKIWDELSVTILSDFKYLISTDSSVATGNFIITPGIGVSYKF